MTTSWESRTRSVGSQSLAAFIAAAGCCVLEMAAQSSGPAWMPIQGGRMVQLQIPATGKSGFELVPGTQSGVQLTNPLHPDRGLTNQIHFNGAGVALGDVDGDGLCDIYFCSIEQENTLYRNLGNWRFEKVAGGAGAGLTGKFSSGAVLADLDGDRDRDLVVNTIGNGTFVFLNDGRGRFQQAGPPLNPGRGGMSLALADFDGNGTVDLYVTNYRTNTLRDMPNTRFQGNLVDGKPTVLQVNGRPTTDPDLVGRYSIGPTGGIIENGEPDVLFLNEGGARFKPVGWTSGAFLDEDGQPLKAPPYDWGLSVMARDLNGDGAPDLYVCNDFDSPDRVWMNDGKGRFRAASRFSFRKTSLFSMGVDVADVDRDGRPDIFVADMLSPIRSVRHSRMGESMAVVYQPGQLDHRPQFMRNMLHWNRGDGTFAEIGFYAGIEASEWSWTPAFLDVDLDGYEDLLITNGHARDDVNFDNANRIGALRSKSRLSEREILMLRRDSPRIAPPNVAFRNRGNLTFEDAGATWNFNLSGISQGMALADLDGDGDLDAVINNLDAAPFLMRNSSIAPRMGIRLKGTPPNTAAIGAMVSVSGAAGVVQSQEWISGGRYLSGDDEMRTFAAGSASNKLTVEIRWRNGRLSRHTGIPANRLCEFDESDPPPPIAMTVGTSTNGPWFLDVSARLQHRHVDEPYDDAERQPLMPWRVSQSGPGAVWSDLNGDGWDDLVIGTGKGGEPSAFLNDRKGGFTAWSGAPFDVVAGRDQTGWAAARMAGTEPTLLFSGSANYEDGLTNGPSVLVWNAAEKKRMENLPGSVASTGPIALGDIDGDGALELFIGGRALAGEYPRAASSHICRRVNGEWKIDSTLSEKLAGAGLVQSALFTDLTGDGKPELVLAVEWGPIRIYKFSDGKLADVSEAWGVGNRTGLWQGLVAGDFDGDGRMDLAAGNWGLNSRYRATKEHPLRAYGGDFDGNGIPECILTEWDPSSSREVPVRGRKAMVKAIPVVAEKQPTFDGYGKASVQEIFGADLNSAFVAEAGSLESVVLLNRGGRFDVKPLPAAAQWSPVYGMAAADFDGDGRTDLFLAQNLFAVDPESAQLDAGIGLLLKGDGRGDFTLVSPAISGIKMYGEQRGVAVSDFNNDGRTDLLVTQYSQETGLFLNQNQSHPPGLRVKLQGEGKNPDAIGARVRAKSAAGWSPVQEIQAGSGYWCQNSRTLVFPSQGPVTEIEVLWPGGRSARFAITAGTREVTLPATGAIQAISN